MTGDEQHRPVPLRVSRPCPLCGRKAKRETYPFCSTRCADIDLNRWLSGGYAIPAAETGGDEEDDPGQSG